MVESSDKTWSTGEGNGKPLQYPLYVLKESFGLYAIEDFLFNIDIQLSKYSGNICWIIEKARKFKKNIHFCFIDFAKAFDCVDHNKLWKILKEMGIPDYFTCS